MTEQEVLDSLVLQRAEPVSEFRFSHSEFPQSAIPNPHSDFADSLVLQQPPASPAGSDLNFNLNLNERAEPYAFLINGFIVIGHLFPYALVVALAVWRS